MIWNVLYRRTSKKLIDDDRENPRAKARGMKANKILYQ